MREINKKLGSAVWSGSLPVTTGYVWGPDTFVPRSGLAEVDRLDLTSSRPGVRAGREYSLPWGREEKDSSLLMCWEKGKGCTDGGEEEERCKPLHRWERTRRRRRRKQRRWSDKRVAGGFLGWTIPPACVSLWRGKGVRDLARYQWCEWAFIQCCEDGAGCLCQSREEKGNPCPLLLAERSQEVFVLVTRTAGAEDCNDMTRTGRL